MRKLGLLGGLLVSTLALGTEQGEPLVPLPFRNYGYFVGDRVTRCWRLAISDPVVLVPPRLPHSLNRWLVVRRADLSGGRLCLEYQVDYAPFTTETVPIPPWSVTLREDDRDRTVTLPAAELMVAPLRPIQQHEGEAFMQPETVPPSGEASPLRWLGLGLALLVGGMAGLGWHLWGGERRVRWPFCRAWLALAKLPDDEAGRLRGYLVLHRAFDAYWGGRWWGRLQEFLARHPGYQPLAAELEEFVTASKGLFFARVAAEPWPLTRLRRLARRLAWEELRRGGLVD